MDRNIDAKFSKFLIGYKVHEHETREFQRAAGSQSALHIPHSAFVSSGLGHGDEIHTTIAVTLLSD
jgi:hypothetical protein